MNESLNEQTQKNGDLILKLLEKSDECEEGWPDGWSDGWSDSYSDGYSDWGGWNEYETN